MRKIAVIGAGFGGLAAAYKLAVANFQVTVIEKEDLPGGLAGGFKKKNWQWTLEKHYHHWFYNDDKILNLAKEISFPVVVERPKTSVYIKNQSYQLDSPYHVLAFSKINIAERLRMATVLGFLRFNPFWKPLEKIKAHDFLQKTMGKKVYEMIWEPQIENKFGKFKNEISLAWFWARIYKRTSRLVYPKGGFLKFAQNVQKEIEKNSGRFLFSTSILEIKNGRKILLTYEQSKKKHQEEFDKVIVTLPSHLFLKTARGLPKDYQNKIKKLKGLGAVNMILRLKNRFLADDTYWLSICDKNSPVTAVVEHTNYMNKKYYGGEHLVYVGNYVSISDPRYQMNDKKLLSFYDSFLKKLNHSFRKNLIGLDVFRAPFAQPIIFTNYSKIIPPFQTPMENVYLADMDQVYPWDRGTNYAVELGEKAADFILNS